MRTGRFATRLLPILRPVQYICLVLGVSSLAWWAWATAEAQLTQASLSRSLAQARRQIPADGQLSPAVREPAAGNPLVGRIDIARIGLSAIVLEGDGSATLRRGVGHIPGTALPGDPGNVGLAGHRDSFFRALENIRRGDEIIVTTVNGSYRYRVVSWEIVTPDETQVLDPSERPSVTLVTCFPFYFIGPAPKRFIVHANRVAT